MADVFWAFWDVSIRFGLLALLLLALSPLLKRVIGPRLLGLGRRHREEVGGGSGVPSRMRVWLRRRLGMRGCAARGLSQQRAPSGDVRRWRVM